MHRQFKILYNENIFQMPFLILCNNQNNSHIHREIYKYICDYYWISIYSYVDVNKDSITKTKDFFFRFSTTKIFTINTVLISFQIESNM